MAWLACFECGGTNLSVICATGETGSRYVLLFCRVCGWGCEQAMSHKQAERYFSERATG